MKPTNIGHRGIFIRCVIRKKHPMYFTSTWKMGFFNATTKNAMFQLKTGKTPSYYSPREGVDLFTAQPLSYNNDMVHVAKP